MYMICPEYDAFLKLFAAVVREHQLCAKSFIRLRNKGYCLHRSLPLGVAISRKEQDWDLNQGLCDPMAGPSRQQRKKASKPASQRGTGDSEQAGPPARPVLLTQPG